MAGTGNKFWGNETSSSSSSSSESEDEAPQVAMPAARNQKISRWAEASSSEDDEVEQRRVVRSHTDKRYAQLLERIALMKNHTKIDDYATLITDYETVVKMLEKLKPVIEKDGGPPGQFVKAIAGLEEYVEAQHAEQSEKKQNKGEKLGQNKAKALNTLRAKVRKGNRDFQDQLERLKEHPEEFESEAGSEDDKSDDAAESDSDASEAGSASSSSSSSSGSSDSSSDSDSDDSDSDSDSSSTSGSGSGSGSSASSSGSSNSDSDSDGENLDKEAAREKKMLRWLITDTKQAEREKKANALATAKKDEKEIKHNKAAKKKLTKGDKASEDKSNKKASDEREEYSPEDLKKKVTDIAQQRGRRGFDRKQYMDKLQGLLPHAAKQGPLPQLYIFSSIVSADFDSCGGAFAAMRIDHWNEALLQVTRMLPLLKQAYEEHDGASAGEADDEYDEDPTSLFRQQELFVAFVEKLDDELYKALQFTVDVYGSEYQEILANSSKFLVLLKSVHKFFAAMQQTGPLGSVSLRLMEQLYYKPDVLNKAVYDAIQSSVPEEEKADWVWPSDSRAFISHLCRAVFATGHVRNQRKASLCQAYHLALHDHFQVARDLLHLGNIQDLAHESQDVHAQILYNRVIAQMGLCAFRLGRIHDAHTCLMEVCMHNKARELLAQGLSFSKTMDRTPEQERAERLRQLPYHMHINLEVLESAHHICAMLLEVPNLAMQSIDPTNKRNMVSRVLRRALEQYDKQVFTGPPENAKEAVVYAAKALQRGDWMIACGALEDLKLWDHIDPGHPEAGARVKAMIKEKIKIEALRTYLFAYASIYDAFHLDQLVGMFDLQPNMVHTIVSKMMIKEEITAFWDESSKFVLVQHVEPTPLQRLALTLADRGAQAVENNDNLVTAKTGGYGIKDQRPQQGNRWDQPGALGKGRGKGGLGGAPMLDSKGGKGKSRGKASSGPPRNRGWENARAGLLRGGSGQRGWSTRPT